MPTARMSIFFLPGWRIGEAHINPFNLLVLQRAYRFIRQLYM